MNPEIARLIAEANGTPVELVNRTNWIFAERLAKLIVHECAAVADTHKPNYLGCGYITETKGMKIKQHFGVES